MLLSEVLVLPVVFDMMTRASLHVRWRSPTTSHLDGAVTSVACVLRNLGLVASLSGALLGSLVIYIFPASAFVAGVQSGVVANKDGSLNAEVAVNKGITVTGYLLAVIGVTVTFVKTFAPHLLK